MNVRKLCSFLLLIAMSFSLVHDYEFVHLDDEHCSAQEYVHELTLPSSELDGDIHTTHFDHHISYILPLNISVLSKIDKNNASFTNNTLFTSYNSFDFLKPPIA